NLCAICLRLVNFATNKTACLFISSWNYFVVKLIAMSTLDMNSLVTDMRAEPSTFSNKLKFIRRIKKSDKRRSTTPFNGSVPAGACSSKGACISGEAVVTELNEPHDKLTKSLTDENDLLRNRNTTLRYQVELLSEQLNDIMDINVDLKKQNSRIREENSILRNDRIQLSAKNECLVEQIIILRQMLEDMGVSVDEPRDFEVREPSAEDRELGAIDVDKIDPLHSSSNQQTPASHRKPPPSSGCNLDFL
uniref:GIT2 protein n=1 Tax=Mesocestoides corti TaxID=53468 RepID=A0A5K3FFK9_MESCO